MIKKKKITIENQVLRLKKKYYIVKISIYRYLMNNYLKFNLKNVLFISFFIFIVLAANSQADYRQAYIISIDNDTTYGWINYNGDLFNECVFKALPEDKPTVYKPFEIVGFRFIDDKYYISKEVTIKNSYEKIIQTFGRGYDRSNLTTTSFYEVEGTQKQKIFIEFLVKGALNLYFYLDKNGVDHYFLENKDSIITDLAREEVTTYQNGKLYYKEESDINKGKIKSIMKDYPKLTNQIYNINLGHEEMINLTSQYHNYVCKDESCIIYKRKINPPKVKLGCYLGVSYAKNNNLLIYMTGVVESFTYDYSVSPIIGFNLHIENLSPRNEKHSLNISSDLSRNNYRLNKYIKHYTVFDDTTIYFRYHATSLLTTIADIYNFTTKENSFFGEFGLVLRYMTGSYDKAISDGKTYFRLVENNYPFNYGFVVGFGYETTAFNKSKKVYAKLRYCRLIEEYNMNFILGFEF